MMSTVSKGDMASGSCRYHGMNGQVENMGLPEQITSGLTLDVEHCKKICSTDPSLQCQSFEFCDDDWKNYCYFYKRRLSGSEPTSTDGLCTTYYKQCESEELTRERNEQGECIPKNSLGKCENCLHSDQCGEGRFCCSYMKKCVKSGSESCNLPVANCKPRCHDDDDQETCTCKYEGFPKTWAKPTCQRGILDQFKQFKFKHYNNSEKLIFN